MARHLYSAGEAMSDKRTGFSFIKLILGQMIGPVSLFAFLVGANVGALWIAHWLRFFP